MNYCVWTVLVLTSITPGCLYVDQKAESKTRSITIDGSFADWEGISPAFTDPRGETGEGNIDFGSLWLANDPDALYLRFEVGRETLWQNESDQVAGNDIRIFLDTDADTETGVSVGVLGADYEIRLGSKVAFLHDVESREGITLNEAGLTLGPSHSGSIFEIRIPFDLNRGQEEARRMIDQSIVRLLIQETTGGDQIPDSGALFYKLAQESVPPIIPLELDRADSGDLRILSHNVQYNRPVENPEPFRRYLEALRPDVVNFQEIWTWDAEATRDFVADILDPGNAEQWYAAQAEDCVTVSRWPITGSAAVDGNLVCRIETPGARGLVLFNAHTPCCGHNDGRDYEHDHIAATWRDLLSGQGPFAAEESDGIVMLGDFNMVGFVRQLASIQDGQIVRHEKFGPDFQPDPDKGSLNMVPLRQTHSNAVYTWRDDAELYPPGRLDFMFYGPGRATLKNNFTLYTPNMPPEVLQQYALRASDSLVSDHLVLVADFEFR